MAETLNKPSSELSHSEELEPDDYTFTPILRKRNRKEKLAADEVKDLNATESDSD